MTAATINKQYDDTARPLYDVCHCCASLKICSVHIIWHVKQHITGCLQHKSWISCNRIPLYAIFFLCTGSYNLNIVCLWRNTPQIDVSQPVVRGPLLVHKFLVSFYVSHYVYRLIATAINSATLHLATYFISIFNVHIVCFIPFGSVD